MARCMQHPATCITKNLKGLISRHLLLKGSFIVFVWHDHILIEPCVCFYFEELHRVSYETRCPERYDELGFLEMSRQTMSSLPRIVSRCWNTHGSSATDPTPIGGRSAAFALREIIPSPFPTVASPTPPPPLAPLHHSLSFPPLLSPAMASGHILRNQTILSMHS